MTISPEEFRAVAAEAERYRRERDYWMAQARATAERQREACARHMVLEQDYSAQACRMAPLVTEGDK